MKEENEGKREFITPAEKPKKKMTVLIKPSPISIHKTARGEIPLRQYGIGLNFLPFPSNGITVSVDTETFFKLRADKSLTVKEVK